MASTNGGDGRFVGEVDAFDVFDAARAGEGIAFFAMDGDPDFGTVCDEGLTVVLRATRRCVMRD